MGSDATAYIFDDTLFMRRVVPALHRAIGSGVCELWLQRVISNLAEASWELDLKRLTGLGFNFARVCSYLGPDFRLAGTPSGQWTSGWEGRVCESENCLARGLCPLHKQRDLLAAEDFNVLFGACVSSQCLGPGQFVGRSVSPLWYADLLEAGGHGPGSPAQRLLGALEYRGYVVGYQFANSDGIHGWLSAAETAELLGALDGLDLPQFEPSFRAMAAFLSGSRYVPPAPYGFKQLSLAFLRTVAHLAVQEGRGLLWANDQPTLAA